MIERFAPPDSKSEPQPTCAILVPFRSDPLIPVYKQTAQGASVTDYESYAKCALALPRRSVYFDFHISIFHFDFDGIITTDLCMPAMDLSYSFRCFGLEKLPQAYTGDFGIIEM
jgi:hypothetical protein